MPIKCCKCGEQLSNAEEILFNESREFDPGARPICDDCWAMMEENELPPEPDDFSNADPRL